MQSARENLLAGAALTQQEDRGIGVCHLLDGPARAQHFAVPRQQTGECGRLLQGLESPVFLLQVEQPERAINGQREKLGLERLGEEVVGAGGASWTYTTVIADAPALLHTVPNRESAELRWVPEEDV